MVALELSSFDEAQDFLSRSILTYRRLDDLDLEARARAIASAAEARRVAEESGDLLTVGLSWRVEGRTLLASHQLVLARAALKRSTRILAGARDEAALSEIREARRTYAELRKQVGASSWRELLRTIIGFGISDLLEAIKFRGGLAK